MPGQIRRLVAALPVDRKVAQLLLVGFDGRDASAPFFSTLRGIDVGGVVVEQRNYNGAAALGSLTGAIRSATAGRSHEAPLILAPQEGGQFSAFPDLPPQTAAGDLSGVLAAAADAARAARTLKRLGFNGVLAPDADVGASSGTDPLLPLTSSLSPCGFPPGSAPPPSRVLWRTRRRRPRRSPARPIIPP